MYPLRQSGNRSACSNALQKLLCLCDCYVLWCGLSGSVYCQSSSPQSDVLTGRLGSWSFQGLPQIGKEGSQRSTELAYEDYDYAMHHLMLIHVTFFGWVGELSKLRVGDFRLPVERTRLTIETPWSFLLHLSYLVSSLPVSGRALVSAVAS